MTTETKLRCDYVLRRAGRNCQGIEVGLNGYGDTSTLCGQPAQVVRHSYLVKRLRTTAVYDRLEGTAVRCPVHQES